MKRKNLCANLVAMACALCMFQVVSAQEQQTSFEGSLSPKFGVKGGLNLSNLYVDDVQDENMKASFNLGLYAKLPLARGFSLQPELLYSGKGAKLAYNNVLLGNGEYRFNLNYVELPVLAVINIVKNLNLQAGPYAAYLVNADITRLNSASGSVDKIKDLKTADFKRFDYGLAGGLGLDVQNFTIGARYNYGLNEVGKGNASVAGQATRNSKNSVISLFIGIGL
ncbi:MAG: PorT family protein [Williamsia sp.]|nr:PorT family protein [Williamsia sp.]